jgi:thiamine biosynthesis lipoprotein
METYTDQFRALGTEAEGGIRADREKTEKLFSIIRAEVFAFENRFSRFNENSELSLLNKNAGSPTIASNEMLELLLAAKGVYQSSNKLVDPTVGSALIQAGYDDSFETLDRSSISLGQHHTFDAHYTFADVKIDIATKKVQFPKSVTLDFGGIGKGFLLDRIAALIEPVTNNYWFSLGGDMVVSGVGDDGMPWPVAVQDPRDLNRDRFSLRPQEGRWAIATSGTVKRKGIHNGKSWHHIIDPKTLQPSESDTIAVTVLAPTGLEADVCAKTILLQGSHDGILWARKTNKCEALITTHDGLVFFTPRMKRMCEPL